MDAEIVGVVPAILLAVALAATWIPAHRATKGRR
jgi:ABC-type lipoprotein release transport system permease subunit